MITNMSLCSRVHVTLLIALSRCLLIDGMRQVQFKFVLLQFLYTIRNVCAELMCKINSVATTQCKGETTSGGTKFYNMLLIKLY
ncbi:hypothetical protein KC19_9G013900 [Ceratodon purpureus]|uniref:Secreted protein n=1 Tax=Ceratodon purpureus TaxID=3225 RepID=A0A8T0GRI1_CERPU|nr:hypothetical protein KC19_9G013900 [Ceratodon purpureus]